MLCYAATKEPCHLYPFRPFKTQSQGLSSTFGPISRSDPFLNTNSRYLESVTPILSPEELREMKSLAEEFKASLGPRLQKYLWIKKLWSDNYVSDWWEEYVYLRGRLPLMINSNYYAVDAIFNKPTTNQVRTYTIPKFWQFLILQVFSQLVRPM